MNMEMSFLIPVMSLVFICVFICGICLCFCSQVTEDNERLQRRANRTQPVSSAPSNRNRYNTNFDHSINHPLTNFDHRINHPYTNFDHSINHPYTNFDHSINDPLTNFNHSINPYTNFDHYIPSVTSDLCHCPSANFNHDSMQRGFETPPPSYFEVTEGVYSNCSLVCDSGFGSRSGGLVNEFDREGDCDGFDSTGVTHDCGGGGNGVGDSGGSDNGGDSGGGDGGGCDFRGAD